MFERDGEVMQYNTHIVIPYFLRMLILYFVHPVFLALQDWPRTMGTMLAAQYQIQKVIGVCTSATRRAGVRVLFVSDPIRLTVQPGNR